MLREFLTLETAPDDLLTLTEVKAVLSLDTSDFDTLLESMMAAATALLDGSGGTLGRALLTQTWTLKRNSFASGRSCHFAGEITLPLAPLQQVNSVKYRDGNNTLQTLSTDRWRVIDRSPMPSSVMPALNQSWPATIGDSPEAVEIEFDCGYGDDAADVPQPIRTAMLQLIAHWFQNREAFTADEMKELPLGAGALLSPYSLNWFS